MPAPAGRRQAPRSAEPDPKAPPWVAVVDERNLATGFTVVPIAEWAGLQDAGAQRAVQPGSDQHPRFNGYNTLREVY